ncbi:MAG: hypothetical protein C4570_05055 [Ammonifex sp.]|jgi:hypothetical protein|nr:MAG: hypothetical protein C4570_05055 [Ammonifex sp.]
MSTNFARTSVIGESLRARFLGFPDQYFHLFHPLVKAEPDQLLFSIFAACTTFGGGGLLLQKEKIR